MAKEAVWNFTYGHEHPQDTEQGSVVVIMGKVVCREEELEWEVQNMERLVRDLLKFPNVSRLGLNGSGCYIRGA